MMKKVITKTFSELTSLSTAHGVGFKKILLSKMEHVSPITQIALTTLEAGELATLHVHETMDEHFIFQEGEGILTVDNVCYECSSGSYILVPASFKHELRAVTTLKILTIGIAL